MNMPDKDLTGWAAIASGLAAFGGYLRYYILNKHKIKTWEWWIGALVDVAASAFIGIIVFMIGSQYFGEVTAAGLAGYAGHIGARQSVLLIKSKLDKLK